jgi:hypothetical protein
LFRTPRLDSSNTKVRSTEIVARTRRSPGILLDDIQQLLIVGRKFLKFFDERIAHMLKMPHIRDFFDGAIRQERAALARVGSDLCRSGQQDAGGTGT